MNSEAERPIGGYFEWEFPLKQYPFPHEDGFLVNNARSALQLILQSIGNVSKVYLPYYTCDSVTLALEAIDIPYKQYHIDSQLQLDEDIFLHGNEYLVYTNYFGIMDSYCARLAEQYGEKLIVDNAQALYAPHIKGTHSIYSCRKYIGVPNGGIAVSDAINTLDGIPFSRMFDRCGALLSRAEDDVTTGYKLFKDNDHRFRDDGILQMSLISKSILHSIDHDAIIAKRRTNFEYLHSVLRKYNKLSIPDMDNFVCSLAYPFYTNNLELRKTLIENGIFVAQYWPNVLGWCDENYSEFNLTTHILPLPIDQRYGIKDMERIISIINS